MNTLVRTLATVLLSAATVAACTPLTPPSQELPSLTARANGGDVDAQLRLAQMYDSGVGAPANAEEAEKWYRRAAETGSAEGQNGLGSGAQAKRRYEEARRWYELAAQQNHAMAIANLGALYDLGLGVPQDRKRGFDLYMRAADLGEPMAMWNLANMYGAGQLGAKDMVTACIWTRRALYYSEIGSAVAFHASRAMSAMTKALSLQDLQACAQQEHDWKPMKS